MVVVYMYGCSSYSYCDSCVLDQAEIHVGVVHCCFASDGITVNSVKFYRLCAWVTYMYVHMYCMCV